MYNKNSYVFLIIFAIFCFVNNFNCLEFTEKYLDVYQNHFDPLNSNKFPLRYLINTDYWQSSSPIFFYTGNEGDITEFADNSRFIWEISKVFKAALIFAEHRYYGISTPNNTNTKYLSSEQALHDYAYLIKYLKDTFFGNVPIICFGGSYGGMLAAWIRIKFPNLVQGSLAASAPLLYFYGGVPCNTFMKIVTENYKNVSEICYQNIKMSWLVINHYFNSKSKLKEISDIFELCDLLKPGDIDLFKAWLQDIYVSMAMANYPYPTNFLAPLPGWPVKEACSHINLHLENNKLLNYIFRAVSVYLNSSGTKICNDFRTPNSKLHRPLLNKNKLGYDNWFFQTCEEMVMPFCTNGITDMFEKSAWNYTEYEDNCQNYFHIKPRKFWLDLFYGGKNPKTSNIIFSNGLLDPWSGEGFLNSLSDTIISIVIPEGAHHLDLRGSSPLDPESVKNARILEIKYIKQWIDEYHI